MFNFTAWPEMLAWPYLILHGWLPYRDIAIAHNPLLLFDLVIFFKLFGLGILQLKIYTWILIGLNTYLTFFVANKFWGKRVALFSIVIYLLLSVIYEGNGLWFDLALTPFALLLFYFIKQKKYLWSGIIFALGFLTKQTFVWFLIVVMLELLKNKKLIVKNLRNFILGSLIIVLPFLITLHLLGILPNFIEWAVKFGIFYLPKAEGQVLAPTIKQFIFSIIPFSILFLDLSLLPWILVGIAGVYPRFELFHFQPALPFLAMSISIVLFSKKNILVKYVIFALIILFIVIGLKRQFGNSTRFYENDVIKVTQELKTVNSNETYIINYWDSIYALTNKLPATRPLIPYIPWYLNYKNNKELILDDLKNKMPETLVLGGKDHVFPDIYKFIEKYYSCNVVSGSVELCYKNK